MTRADLLRSLVESHVERNDASFINTVQEIIAEERKKHHIVVANELQSLLMGAKRKPMPSSLEYGPIPMDPEKNVPLVHIRDTKTSLEDLVLDRDTQDALQEITEQYRGWEILTANGIDPVRHVLFCGPPGCGKTSAAEAIAKDLGLPLLYVRFDSVVSSLLGETSANLRRVFDFALRGQWVVLFDEFDAVGRSRDDASEHGEIKRVVNSYLQLIDGFEGRSLVIAATNFQSALDPAIWRRFDEAVVFDMPSRDQISILIERSLRPLRYSASVMEQLEAALDGASHADVERICVDIRRNSALAGDQAVTSSSLARALRKIGMRREIIQKSRSSAAPRIDGA